MDLFDVMNMRETAMGSAAAAGAGIPASRQKSCNACVRGKRRCDKTFPRCTRCAAKGLECVYAKLPPAFTPSSSSGSGLDLNGGAPDQGMPDFDMVGGFDLPDLGNSSTSTTSPESLTLDPNLDFSMADLLGATSGQSNSLWTMPTFGEGKTTFGQPKATFPSIMNMPVMPQQPIRDLATYNAKRVNDEECMEGDITQIHDPRSRAGYVVAWIKNFHIQFATTRALPFLHSRLYAGAQTPPKTMVTAFAAASVYAHRTEETKPWAVRVLVDGAKQILEDGAKAKTVLEKVARVQALLILDTMRMFDGDVSLRVGAEKDAQTLAAWCRELPALEKAKTKEWDGKGKDCPPKNWENWLLLECMRRTITTSFAFLCLLCVLKMEIPDCDIWSDDQRFTASKHLWEAETSVDFHRAWREQPQWVICNLNLDDFWQYARADDVDDFTKWILTVQIGVEAMDHFMSGDLTYFGR